ncbi:MAG: protein kinase, partial [Candidatus Krumholzibacteria bacterium]|nr:protein kinase [Candidatus Krumholzibacteria bacterium]
MIGKTISHYMILEELGRGGMGVVYRAVDLDLERAVAIKFLPQHLSRNEGARQRFIHEAKAASALNHSNIGVIHEIGRTDDGQTFIVMAYYEGETLRERIDRGGMSMEEALDIATQVASGLAKSHDKDIVHRDIKPSNIIITKDREAKIIDFGLAKLAGKTKLTKEGSTLGTAAYMSPEQARGEEVDHRSDIFSLGSILYEMLAGEPPFKGEHEAALLYCIVHEEQKHLGAVQPQLPGSLEDIVNRCLAKDPSDRFERTGELADHLRGLVRETAGSASGRPAKTGTKKGRVAVVAAAICITAVVVFLLSDYFRGRDLREMQPVAVDTKLADRWAHSIAVLPFRDLSPGKDQEHVCLGLTDAVNGILSSIHELKVISTTS